MAQRLGSLVLPLRGRTPPALRATVSQHQDWSSCHRLGDMTTSADPADFSGESTGRHRFGVSSDAPRTTRQRAPAGSGAVVVRIAGWTASGLHGRIVQFRAHVAAGVAMMATSTALASGVSVAVSDGLLRRGAQSRELVALQQDRRPVAAVGHGQLPVPQPPLARSGNRGRVPAGRCKGLQGSNVPISARRRHLTWLIVVAAVRRPPAREDQVMTRQCVHRGHHCGHGVQEVS